MTTLGLTLSYTRAINWRRLVLTWIAAVFYFLGWLPGAFVRAVKVTCTFVAASAKLGYTEGRRGPA